MSWSTIEDYVKHYFDPTPIPPPPPTVPLCDCLRFKESVKATVDAYLFTERERAQAQRDVETAWTNCFGG